MRALIVSLNTYSSSFNDEKLAELGRRVESVTAVAGDLPPFGAPRTRAALETDTGFMCSGRVPGRATRRRTYSA